MLESALRLLLLVARLHGLRFAFAVGASCVVGSDVVCGREGCKCGKCALPKQDGTQCCSGPFSYAQAPTNKDTGGNMPVVVVQQLPRTLWLLPLLSWLNHIGW